MEELGSEHWLNWNLRRFILWCGYCFGSAARRESCWISLIKAFQFPPSLGLSCWSKPCAPIASKWPPPEVRKHCSHLPYIHWADTCTQWDVSDHRLLAAEQPVHWWLPIHSLIKSCSKGCRL
jgi:hypothetical protein